MQHAERRLAQRLGDGELVHLLVVALLQVDDLAFGRTADQDHRKAVRRRIGERDQAVQEARRRDREAHARRLCQPPRDRRRIAGVLLVPERDHPHPLGLRQTAQIGDRDARDVIDRLDAVQLQRVDDQVEPVRQFGFGFADTSVQVLRTLDLLPMRIAGAVRRPSRPSVEKIAVLLDMRRQPHRVLAHQPLGQVGVAPLQCGDDVAMIGDRALRPVVLRHRHRADRAHVDEQVVGQAGHQLDAAHADDRLVELHVGARVFADLLRRVLLEHIDQGVQFRQLRLGHARRGEAGGHALDRRPDGDHLDHLALRLAHHDQAAARHRADEAFLLQHRQRLADRRAAHAEVLRELALVQPDLAADGRRCSSR